MMNSGMPMDKMGMQDMMRCRHERRADADGQQRAQAADGRPDGRRQKEPDKGDGKQEGKAPTTRRGQARERPRTRRTRRRGGSNRRKPAAKNVAALRRGRGEKDVWGHLPDKLQADDAILQEDVMPRYSELLRLYYSSLSEKGAQPPLPKK